jgi:hypothetical protein
MKYLKILAVAIIAMFAFEGAKAQVVVGARIGGAPVYHPRRTVVVTHPVYHRRVVYRRPVIVARPVMYRNPYRRTVVRPVYYRHPHKRVIVRHY